jgi:hypothetical protein
MAAFFGWLESMGWQAALCFLAAIVIAMCAAVLVIDAAIRKYAAYRERAAIRERLWEERKREFEKRLDAQRPRVARDDIQRRREVKQFHISAAFRDMKGTHR